ncbi:hypothetical protein T484DRAFT_1937418, partial [Baffinella frigidus]
SCGVVSLLASRGLYEQGSLHLIVAGEAGESQGLEGGAVLSVLPKTPGGVLDSPGMEGEWHARLSHRGPGIVSIPREGFDGRLVITLAPARHLDATHRIIGRVSAGLKALRSIQPNSPSAILRALPALLSPAPAGNATEALNPEP